MGKEGLKKKNARERPPLTLTEKAFPGFVGKPLDQVRTEARKHGVLAKRKHLAWVISNPKSPAAQRYMRGRQVYFFLGDAIELPYGASHIHADHSGMQGHTHELKEWRAEDRVVYVKHDDPSIAEANIEQREFQPIMSIFAELKRLLSPNS